jgi:hypothetical protein
MKFIKKHLVIILTALLIIPNIPLQAQVDKEEHAHGIKDSVMTLYVKSRPIQRVGNTFESVWLIDNQTTYIPYKNTIEFDIQHRFGTIDNGYKDFFGMYAPSNIRLGLNYSVLDNLNLGFGFTKFNLIWDLNAKFAILSETGEKKSPVNLSFFHSTSYDSRSEENFVNNTDRLGYYNSLMLSRKLTRNFSAQASVNFSHMNAVEGFLNDNNEVEGRMKNDHLSVSILARYKISDATGFIADIDLPITNHNFDQPLPNISAGIEVATPLHAFQAFIGNYQHLVPNYSNFYNSNDFSDGGFLVGFNITRLIDLQEEDMAEMMIKKRNIHY